MAVDRAIVVCLVHQDESGRFTAPLAPDRQYWTEAARALGDPYLGIETLGAP